MRIALTGASGFIGRHVAHRLAGSGELRLLLRRRDEALTRLGATCIAGSLEDEEALERLVDGCGTVVHVAGIVQAPATQIFDEVNHRAAYRLAAIAAARGATRFVLFSSLAARAPDVSAYARSKALAEAAVNALGDRMQVVVVRPPAVYGPGDRATFEIFRGLARGRLVLPVNRRARFSLLYVEDLASLTAMLVRDPLPRGLVLEPDDGTPGGYDWPSLVSVASEATGRPIALVTLPRPLAGLIAAASEQFAALTGGQALLPRDKLGELYHPDWICRIEGLDAVPGWRPRVRFAEGVLRTLDWYRAAGWFGGPSRFGGRTTREPIQ